MSQTIEIEFKNLLSREEFDRMVSFFQLHDDQFIKQINHYFDTKSFALKNKGCALRIREKDSQYEMTLKQPHSDGLLETNQTITAQEAQAFINGGPLKNGAVKSQITTLGIDYTEFVYFGTLTTERAEWDYQNGLLVLDKSTYLNTEDYEVEYEVIKREDGLPIFVALLSQLKIPVRQTKNKIQRFYEQKMK